MKQLLVVWILLFTVAFGCCGAIINTQGVQDFVNGTFPANYAGGITDTSSPFNLGLIGYDSSDLADGGNFDATWTHSYGAIASSIVSATLTIGLWEHDSAEPGDQVAVLTLNGGFGGTLTPIANSALNASGGTTDLDGNSEYNVYTLALPSAVFASLQTGTAQIRLALQGPVATIFDIALYNGAAIDFATLDITTQEDLVIPEPSTAALAGLALPALLFLGRRRR